MELISFTVFLNNTRLVFKLWYKIGPIYSRGIYQCCASWKSIDSSLRRYSSFQRNNYDVTKEILILWILSICSNCNKQVKYIFICQLEAMPLHDKIHLPFYSYNCHFMIFYFVKGKKNHSHRMTAWYQESRDGVLNQRIIQESYLSNFINWINSCERNEP